MNPLLTLLAAEGHAPPPLIDVDGTVFVQLGIFLVVLFVLNRLVFKPYLALRHEQVAHTTGAMRVAEEEAEAAREKLETYERQIMNTRREAALGRGERREAGKAKANELLAQARARADHKIAAARDKIARSAPTAQQALQARADELAKAVATKVLGRQL